MSTKPNKKALEEYNNGTKQTKELLEGIFGKKAFPQPKPAKPVRKKKTITERVKTFEDVLREVKESKESFNKRTKAMASDTVAFEKLKLISKALNEGTVLTSNNYRYYPWFDVTGSGFVFDDTYSYCTSANAGLGPRLCFKSDELAEYAGRTFLVIYCEFYGKD